MMLFSGVKSMSVIAVKPQLDTHDAIIPPNTSLEISRVAPIPLSKPFHKMRREFTDEERATHTDQTDLRYWPEETQHQYVRKLIPQLGHLARGFDEVAVVEGAIGTEMVTLPGVLSPLEWDPQRWATCLYCCMASSAAV